LLDVWLSCVLAVLGMGLGRRKDGGALLWVEFGKEELY
jgi:hypothetical protein